MKHHVAPWNSPSQPTCSTLSLWTKSHLPSPGLAFMPLPNGGKPLFHILWWASLKADTVLPPARNPCGLETGNLCGHSTLRYPCYWWQTLVAALPYCWSHVALALAHCCILFLCRSDFKWLSKAHFPHSQCLAVSCKECILQPCNLRDLSLSSLYIWDQPATHPETCNFHVGEVWSKTF